MHGSRRRSLAYAEPHGRAGGSDAARRRIPLHPQHPTFISPGTVSPGRLRLPGRPSRLAAATGGPILRTSKMGLWANYFQPLLDRLFAFLLLLIDSWSISL